VSPLPARRPRVQRLEEPRELSPGEFYALAARWAAQAVAIYLGVFAVGALLKYCG
jgi:hypothetical protein